jgi:hypothetical protein
LYIQKSFPKTDRNKSKILNGDFAGLCPNHGGRTSAFKRSIEFPDTRNAVGSKIKIDSRGELQ